MAESGRPRPALVAPRQAQTLEAVREVTRGGFDVDAWHVMEARDDALIRDEILHGAGSSTFVYSFDIGGGKIVSGISVVGARHLAHYYKGLKHRMVASTAKTGKLLTFTSYPSEFGNMSMTTAVLDDLEAEEDFYSAICEVIDLKTGNSIQVERREARYEERRGGGWFERPNYPTIAQSKAYRNAILALLPQDVIIPWKLEQLRLKKEEVITAGVLDEKRANVLHFAAQKAIALDRHAVEGLTLDQIGGLGDAAREANCRPLSWRPRRSGSISRSRPRRARPSRNRASNRAAGRRNARPPRRNRAARPGSRPALARRNRAARPGNQPGPADNNPPARAAHQVRNRRVPRAAPQPSRQKRARRRIRPGPTRARGPQARRRARAARGRPAGAKSISRCEPRRWRSSSANRSSPRI